MAAMEEGRRTAGFGQEQPYEVCADGSRCAPMWANSSSTPAAAAARGDVLPSQNIHRRIIDDLMDR
jgi:hypothetical protein